MGGWLGSWRLLQRSDALAVTAYCIGHCRCGIGSCAVRQEFAFAELGSRRGGRPSFLVLSVAGGLTRHRCDAVAVRIETRFTVSVVRK